MTVSNSSAYENILDAIRDHGQHVVEKAGGRAQAQCPAHDDASPSLSVSRIDGSALVYCHAGCETVDVLAAVSMTPADLYDDRRGATYSYPDGRQVHRSPAKRFRQSGNTKGRALFHSDRIGAATEVYVCEGEKDVLAVELAGGVAVCPAMGAGKAHLSDWEPLRGKRVTVVADKDAPGRKHAAEVAGRLDGIAGSVRIVEPAAGGDAADHIAAGKALGELVAVDSGIGGAGVDPAPRLWRATDLRPAEQPRWLAKGRLPRAAISLLVGDEGIGKSLMWVWVAAAVTTGKPLPEFGIPETDPGHVIVVVTEDDWCSTVRPRLEVAGADLANISVICTEDDGSGAPVFPRDLHLIADAAPAPALVVVDAWLDTVPPGLSVRDPQHARQALHPWREIATATDAAVLLLTHTNRVASMNARDRYGATGELRKKARMTLFAQADDDGRLIVGPEKMNTAAPIPASTFTIRSVQHFDPTDDSDGTVPELVYSGDSDQTAREHLAASADPEGEGGDTLTEAELWLQDYLTEQGAAPSKMAKADAAKAGIRERTLQRAAKRVGVATDSRGFPRVTWWQLPGASSGDSRASGAPVSRGLGATGATVVDLHKRVGATGSVSQSRQAESDGATGGATVSQGGAAAKPGGVRRCAGCREPLFAAGSRDRGVCERCRLRGAGQQTVKSTDEGV